MLKPADSKKVEMRYKIARYFANEEVSMGLVLDDTLWFKPKYSRLQIRECQYDNECWDSYYCGQIETCAIIHCRGFIVYCPMLIQYRK